MSNTARFQLSTRTETPDLDIWTVYDARLSGIWTAILASDGRDTIVTPLGCHVSPEAAEWAETQAFIDWLIAAAS